MTPKAGASGRLLCSITVMKGSASQEHDTYTTCAQLGHERDSEMAPIWHDTLFLLAEKVRLDDKGVAFHLCMVLDLLCQMPCYFFCPRLFLFKSYDANLVAYQ